MTLAASTPTIIAIALFLIIALASTFIAWRWSPIPAWLSLLGAYLIPHTGIAATTVIYWGIASAIALGITVLLPRNVAASRVGCPYMAGATLAGAFAGMLMPLQQAGMIIGAVAGLLLGAIAFSRTPAGTARRLIFPSRQWLNYTCAKGFPIVITIVTAAIALMAVIRIYNIPAAA